MSKNQNSERLIAILESLSDISITLVADFFADDKRCGGLPVAIGLAELGVTVFPVGVAGDDEAGQQILHALQEHRVSTGGISKLKNYRTLDAGAGYELIHGEHPALLNLIDHARKFVSASEGLYLCDHGVGAASPRLLNFIKSNGCLREKTLGARSLHRLEDFEQLTTAVAGDAEISEAIGIEIEGDPLKLAVAGRGIVEEMGLESFLAASAIKVLAFRGTRKPISMASASPPSALMLDFLGAFWVAALATGAEVEAAAQLAVQLSDFILTRPAGAKRIRREELLKTMAARN